MNIPDFDLSKILTCEPHWAGSLLPFVDYYDANGTPVPKHFKITLVYPRKTMKDRLQKILASYPYAEFKADNSPDWHIVGEITLKDANEVWNFNHYFRVRFVAEEKTIVFK